jgi:hypothetical protein
MILMMTFKNFVELLGGELKPDASRQARFEDAAEDF